MQCGTATDHLNKQEQFETLQFIQPAIIGSIAIGVLSSLPIINLGNYFCCMWVVGGGALASWSLIKQNPGRLDKLTIGDGAFVGVLSGIIGSIIGTLISLPFRLLAVEGLKSQKEAVEQLLNEHPEIDGLMRDLILLLLSPEISVSLLLVNLFLNLIIFSLFAMIGGIIMVVILKKETDPEGLQKDPSGKE